MLCKYDDPCRFCLVSMIIEQQEIAKRKASGEALTWSDLNKMKHTWCAAMEILRMIPPIFGNFRRALKDIEYEGYLIPKGWLVRRATTTSHKIHISIFFSCYNFWVMIRCSGHQASHRWTSISLRIQISSIQRGSRSSHQCLPALLWHLVEGQGCAPAMSLQGWRHW